MADTKTYDEIDRLVDTDPIALRDYAWHVTQELTRLRERDPSDPRRPF